MYKKLFFAVFIIFIMLNINFCSRTTKSSKKNENVEVFLKNPFIEEAIDESNIDIFTGDNPPDLSGEYLTDAFVTDAHDLIVDYLKNQKISSTIILYDQTNTNEIKLIEKIQNLTVYGSGGYITGEDNKFTIWQESTQSGGESGLSDDIAIVVLLIISGIRTSEGNLIIQGMSVITSVESDNNNYNTNAITGVWWMYEGNFYLQDSAIISKSSDIRTALIPNHIIELIHNH